ASRAGILTYGQSGGGNSAAFHVDLRTPARISADDSSYAVPFVRLRCLARLITRMGGNDDDLSGLVDFDAGDIHTGRSDCLARCGHVLLPECGGRAGHR